MSDLYFVTLKGTLGKETFLTDFEGLASLHSSFHKELPYEFVVINPSNLEDKHIISRKHGAIYGFDVREAKQP